MRGATAATAAVAAAAAAAHRFATLAAPALHGARCSRT